jgi:hypothetical protein
MRNGTDMGFKLSFNLIFVPHFNPISVPHFNPISVPFRILTSYPFRVLIPYPFRILTPSVPLPNFNLTHFKCQFYVTRTAKNSKRKQTVNCKDIFFWDRYIPVCKFFFPVPSPCITIFLATLQQHFFFNSL